MRVEASGAGGAGNGDAGFVAGLPAGALPVQPLREFEPAGDASGVADKRAAGVGPAELRRFSAARRDAAEWEMPQSYSCFAPI